MSQGETFTAAACQGYWGALGMTREFCLCSLLSWSLLPSSPPGKPLQSPLPTEKSQHHVGNLPGAANHYGPNHPKPGSTTDHGTGADPNPTELLPPVPAQGQPLHPLQLSLLPTPRPFRTTPKATNPEITPDQLKTPLQLRSPRCQPAYSDKPRQAQPFSQMSIPACLCSHTAPRDGQHPAFPRTQGHRRAPPVHLQVAPTAHGNVCENAAQFRLSLLLRAPGTCRDSLRPWPNFRRDLLPQNHQPPRCWHQHTTRAPKIPVVAPHKERNLNPSMQPSPQQPLTPSQPFPCRASAGDGVRDRALLPCTSILTSASPSMPCPASRAHSQPIPPHSHPGHPHPVPNTPPTFPHSLSL